MADAKIKGVGSALSTEVAQQIDIRKGVIGKTSDRTSDDLLYMNANTAWVRLSSGVNTVTDAEIAQLRKQQGRTTITGDSTLAGYNILQGGLLAPDRSLREGIDTSGYENQQAAYNNRKLSTGIRPMPGITGMNVQSKNTYGTLREADVKFSVWTLEDFEIMEQIYLRPGFTMLLEWGHSLYYNNSKEFISKEIQGVPSRFFQSGVTMSSILSSINDIRKKASYNYEGMVGYVKNFSWSYKPNGEYECSISIISTGEILESIKMKLDPVARGIPAAETDSATSEKGKDQRKSIYHFFSSKLEKITSNPWTLSHLKRESPTMGGVLQPFTAYYYNVDYKAAGNWFFDDSIPTHWIPLSTFLDIINNYVSTVDQTKAKGSIDRSYIHFNTDINSSSKFITFPEHFSIDPTVCVLQYKTPSGLGVVRAIHNKLIDPAGGYDDVLNVLISVPYIKKTFDAALDDKQGLTKSIGELVQEILDSISTALGGINDFSLTYDEEVGRGTYFVIDRNNTAQTEDVPVLQLAGLNSIFTEVGISSKITNEIASQISIAAQGSSQNTAENMDNILRWNPGVIDRLNVTKDASDTEKKSIAELAKDLKERQKEWVKDVKEFFTAFSTSGWKDEQMEAAKTMHAELTVQGMKNAKYKDSKPIPGIVPVELSFKLDGLGGFKVGECFKIAEGILPSKYNDKFGYIVTGLEHSIGSNNRWETSIRTQFYLIEKTSPSESIDAEFEVEDDYEVQKGASTGKGGSDPAPPKYTSQSCIDDSKVKLSPSFNLAQLSCQGIVERASIPAANQVKTHPTYGRLSREDIIDNLRQLAVHVLEPIKQKYPTMFVTNAYRNRGNKSQHDAGMAADIQFRDITGSLSAQNASLAIRAQEIKQLLGNNYDQFLLEYKTDRGGRPWIHISYNKAQARKEASTFLNDKYAANGRNNLYNPLT